LVAADFVPEYRESSGNADALYTMCQDKEEKHIHIDSITVAESDQNDYKERHSEYIPWKNQRTNSFQNMMCLLGSVKECDIFNSDDTAGDQAGYYFSRARPPDGKETYVRRTSKTWEFTSLHEIGWGPPSVKLHQRIFGLLVSEHKLLRYKRQY
jgi:hypothetical protein